MSWTLVCLVLTAVLPFAATFTFTPVPIYYVTESDISSAPKEQYVFNVPLCGGDQFEHFHVNFFVNFPDKKWNPIVGDYVAVVVQDIHGHTIGSNSASGGNYLNQFSLLYHKQYSDLRLIVTSGNSPDLKYTLTVTFTNSTTSGVNVSPPLMKSRYFKSEEEKLTWSKLVSTLPDGNTQELMTVFKTTEIGCVSTADATGLHLGYCFDPDQFPGSIYISTFATDEISGFATYACTHAENCTSTEAAKFYDTSGASVNFVKVDLADKTQVGPINVLVRGDGRDGGQNHFTLSGSKFVPAK